MFLASTAILAATLFPAQSADPDERVNIPDTEINVCVIADIEDLGTLEVAAQVALDAADVTFPELKALCGDEPTAPPTVVVPAPPIEVLPPASSGGGEGAQVTRVPRGAPETGDGSATSQVPLGVGALALIGVPVAFGLHARRQASARR